MLISRQKPPESTLFSPGAFTQDLFYRGVFITVDPAVHQAFYLRGGVPGYAPRRFLRESTFRDFISSRRFLWNLRPETSSPHIGSFGTSVQRLRLLTSVPLEPPSRDFVSSHRFLWNLRPETSSPHIGSFGTSVQRLRLLTSVPLEPPSRDFVSSHRFLWNLRPETSSPHIGSFGTSVQRLRLLTSVPLEPP